MFDPLTVMRQPARYWCIAEEPSPPVVLASDYDVLLALYLEHKNTAIDVHWLAAQLESRLSSDSARIRKENAGMGR